MRRVAALLAAALALGSAALASGCGGDGAEPGAPDGATLILDFTPNAAHTGIYTALRRGYYRDAGVDLRVEQPGDSTDGPKLLAAGKVDFAILDIHDLGLAREKGYDVRGVLPIVQRPLGSVIARADRGIRSPADLQRKTVGVTGLPSDDAVLASEVAADGGDPNAVKTVNIGFNAVPDLAAGKIDAATAFWNAEGVALRSQGVPVRIFKVDRFGAPRYPELILCTSGRLLGRQPALVRSVAEATERGYRAVQRDKRDLTGVVDDIVAEVPALDRSEITAQLKALGPALDPAPFDPKVLAAWSEWDVEHDILQKPVDVAAAFPGPPGN